MNRWGGPPRLLTLICVAGAALALAGISAPASRAIVAPQAELHTAQLWPAGSAGVAEGLLAGQSDVPLSLAHPYGSAAARSGDIVRGRTYLSFPMHVLPPGTDVLRATLYVHADTASASGEAQLGVYRVTAPWDALVPRGDAGSWPDLMEAPISTSLVRVSGSSLGALGPGERSTALGRLDPSWMATLRSRSTAGRPGPAARVPGLAIPASQQETHLLIHPEESAVDVGDIIQVSVRVEGANGLRWAEFVIDYDPRIVEVVDSDPDTAGVQIELGPFLDPDGADLNRVAPDRGVIEVAQEAGGAPATGGGVLAQITFRGLSAGTSQIAFADVLLEDQLGGDVPSSDQSGTIIVGDRTSAVASPSPTPGATATPTPTVTPFPATLAAAEPSSTPPTSPLPTLEPGDVEGRAVTMRPFAGTWASWDVTVLLRAWLSGGADNYGLAIASAPRPNADLEVTGDLLLARWASAFDPETAPYIVVEYRVLPVTPTPTVTPPPLLPPAGRSDPVRLGGLITLALVGLALLCVGVGSIRRQR